MSGNSTTFKATARALALGIMTLAISSLSAYAANALKKFNIEGQPASSGLNEFAKQADITLVFSSDLVAGSSINPIKGEYSISEALRLMLEGTTLGYQQVSESTVAISRRTQSIGANGITQTSVQLARVNADLVDSPNVQATTQAAAPPEANKSTAESEVVVTGSHIRGVDNPTTPLIVMDREFIDSTGMSTTTQLIESLPQNFSLTNQSAAGGSLSGNSFSTIQGSSINLRAVGEGTTLTLVNGHRMPLSYYGSAVNVSTIPLSAIERVEVLTDGASALYGSDAVGGVVNFILRQDFDGAETRVRYGQADDIDEMRISQTLGRSWSSGSVVVTAEHYQRDMLLASDRNYGIGAVTTVGTLLPKEKNYALSTFVRQDLTATLDAFFDVIYTDRDSVNRSFQFSPTADATIFIDNAVMLATAGLGWDMGGEWRTELSAGYGEDDLKTNIRYTLGATSLTQTPLLFKTKSADLSADGPIFDLPGGKARLAVGAQWRDESQNYNQLAYNMAGVQTISMPYSNDRSIKSAFAEASVPLIGSPNAKSFAQNLDLSLAARYDEYSDFGSSVDPRVGLAWMPVKGFKVRAGWGTSYVAPKISDYNLAFNTAIAVTNYPAANNLTYFQISGNAPETLKPQESTNYTIGFEWEPEVLPGASFTVNYYNIEYKDRIEAISLTYAAMISTPGAEGALYYLDPSPALIQQMIASASGGRGFTGYSSIAPVVINPNFDLSTIDILVDARRRNIGKVVTKGIDLSANYEFDALGGSLNFGVDGAYILNLEKAIAANTPEFSVRDTFANPTRLKLRGTVGYRRAGWHLNAFVHRKNSYTDTRFAPFVPIEAYTTVDANVSYRFQQTSGFLSNLTVGLNGLNIADRDPPQLRVRAGGFYDMGFDTANASPLGRMLTMEVSKRW